MTAALKVGDVLFFVRDRHHNPGTDKPVPVCVLKVGRRWVTVGGVGHHMRFALDDADMEIDGAGYKSPGRCWLSEKAYTDHQAATAAWDALRAHVLRTKAPAGVTIERIAEARRLLGLKPWPRTGEPS